MARLLVVSALLIGLGGCGGNGGGGSSGLDTKAILESTAKRLDATKSVHFDLAIEGAAFIDTARTTQLRSANGDIVPPDQMQTKIKVAVATLNLDLSLVSIGADRYMTDPVTGRWGPAQPGFDYSPTILFDKQQGLSSVLGKLREVEQLAAEKVNGVESYHLRGKADRATIEPLTSGSIDGDPIAVEFWVAKEGFALQKLILTEPKTPDKAQPAVWTLIFSKFDEPVTIARPQKGDLTPAARRGGPPSREERGKHRTTADGIGYHEATVPHPDHRLPTGLLPLLAGEGGAPQRRG